MIFRPGDEVVDEDRRVIGIVGETINDDFVEVKREGVFPNALYRRSALKVSRRLLRVGDEVTLQNPPGGQLATAGVRGRVIQIFDLAVHYPLRISLYRADGSLTCGAVYGYEHLCHADGVPVMPPTTPAIGTEHLKAYPLNIEKEKARLEEIDRIRTTDTIKVTVAAPWIIFCTDPRVVAFVKAKTEGVRSREKEIRRICWEKNENNWRTEAELRASLYETYED